MPRNGNGTFNLVSGNPVVAGTVIRTTWANPTMADIATALTNSLAKDGQTAPTANLPMAGFKLTGLGVGSALTDSIRVSQVQDGSVLRCTAEAMPSTDVYTAALPFGATSFVNGQQIVLKFPTVNAGTTPTLAINGASAATILRSDGSAIQAGDLLTAVPSRLMWNSPNWLLLGYITTASIAGVASFNTRTGNVTLSLDDVLDALGYIPVQSVFGRTGIVTVAQNDITTALGYTPLNVAGGTMTGNLNTVGGDQVASTFKYTRVNFVGPQTGTINVNWASRNWFAATIGGAGASFAFSNLPSAFGQYVVLDLTNAGVATSTASLFPGVLWPGGAATHPLTASGRDIICLGCDSGTPFMAWSSINLTT